jgi:hypothetical protein
VAVLRALDAAPAAPTRADAGAPPADLAPAAAAAAVCVFVGASGTMLEMLRVLRGRYLVGLMSNVTDARVPARRASAAHGEYQGITILCEMLICLNGTA